MRSRQRSCAIELERRQNQLRDYRQAIDDVAKPKEHDRGINLDEGDIAITPEVALKFWRGHVTKCKRNSTHWKTWPAATISRRAPCAVSDVPQRY